MKKHYEVKSGQIQLHPYRKQYIEKYHQWMQDPELLELTGSEPLTLQQQLNNQKSWLEDPTKYTFIIFYNNQMVGDVNLFFSKWIEPNECEINIMIAEKSHRGKGIGRQVLTMIQQFAHAKYNKNEIIAKIKKGNEGSIKLFQKAGYAHVSYSERFQEHEYRRKIPPMNQQDFVTAYEVHEVYQK